MTSSNSQVAIFDGKVPLEGLVVKQNQTWADNLRAQYPQLFSTTGPAQHPNILYLGCCDSRVPETELLGLLPGEVFTHRNIGNMINPTDKSWPAALRYAVDEIGVRNIIVCGHIGCGACKTVAQGTHLKIPEIDGWLAPLFTLWNTYQKTIASQPDFNSQWAELVTLSVQQSLAILSADTSLSAVTLHGAIYDVNTGYIRFLDGDAQKLPPASFVQDVIALGGEYKTQDIVPGNITSLSRTVPFTKSYTTAPRIFVGLAGCELHYGSRIQFFSTFTNITNTGFDVNVTAAGDTQIAQSTFVWMEIPNEPAYAQFQTGAVSVGSSVTTAAVNHLDQAITFPNAYTTPPTVVVLPTGWDIDAASTFKVSATQITTTGFTIHQEMANGQQLRGGNVSWLAYPANSPIGLSSGVIGNTAPTTQNWEQKGTVTFAQPASAGGSPCLAMMGLSSFATSQSWNTMYSVFNSVTATGGNWALGKWAGGLTTIDATYVSWVPNPQTGS